MDYGSPDGGWTARAEANDPNTVGIWIDGAEHTRAVPDGARAVAFRVNLEADLDRLETRFEGDGGERGAYFASIFRT